MSERLDAMPRICNWPFCLVSIVLFIAFSFIFIRILILVVQLSIFRRKILRFKVTGNKLGELLANEQIPFLISSCFCLFQRQSVRAALLLRCFCCCCALPFPQLVSGKRKLTTFSPSYLHNQFRAFVMRQKANGKCWAHDRICCCFLALTLALSLSSCPSPIICSFSLGIFGLSSSCIVKLHSHRCWRFAPRGKLSSKRKKMSDCCFSRALYVTPPHLHP